MVNLPPKICPQCGEEYVHTVQRCVDCDVPLGLDAPAEAPAPSGSALMVSVEFRGMAEWQDISRRLAATPGIQNLDVAGLSARGARVTFSYAEGPQRLAQALDAQGLSLRNSGGAWVLSAR